MARSSNPPRMENSLSEEDQVLADYIVARCRQLQQNGIRIEDGGFGVEWNGEFHTYFPGQKNCVCPLGAVVAYQKTDIENPSVFELASDILKVDFNWLCGFINAFDRGSPPPYSSAMNESHRRGLQVGTYVRNRIYPRSRQKRSG